MDVLTLLIGISIFYGVANLVFAFKTAPAWLARWLGPCIRTRRSLVPDLSEPDQTRVGRFLDGVCQTALSLVLLYIEYF